MKKLNYDNKFSTKLIVYVCGLTFFALGLSICATTELGLGPWDVLAQGIARSIGVGLGDGSIIVSFIVLTFALLLKVIPGIGTFFNIIVIGVLIDVFLPWATIIFATTNIFLLIVVYLIGLVLMSAGSSLYIIARFGAGPRDSLLLGLVSKFKVSTSIVKPVIEGFVLVIGVLLKGTFGIGTIINLLLMGYLMDFVFKKVDFNPKEVKQYNIFEQFQFIKTKYLIKK